MKKSIKNIILLPAIALGLSSCSDWLELKPTTEIIEEDMWQNQDDVEAVVASCYNAMLSNDFMTRAIVFGELRSDNMSYNRNASGELDTDDQEMYRSISLSSVTSTDWICSWAAFYNVINICNYVIHYAPNVCNLDPDYLTSEMNANLAEAYAIRALCYFYLIRTFDRVPYVDEPTINDQQEIYLPQTEQDVIINHMISDLTFAVNNARSVYPAAEETKFRITRRAAAAILADVYLWQASSLTYPADSIAYDEAIKYCDIAYNTDETPSRVSGSALYSFYGLWDGSGSYGDIFESSIEDGGYPSEEIIFAVEARESTFGTQTSGSGYTSTYMSVNQLYGPVSTAGTRGDLATHYLVAPNDNYPTQTSGNIDYSNVTTSVFKVMSTGTGGTNDVRYGYNSGLSNNSYCIYKYNGGQSSVSNYPDWIFYRVSDIYLMKAEAIAEKMNCRFSTTDSDGASTTVFLNYQDNPTVYNDSMQKVFNLCYAVFQRCNQTTMNNGYTNYASSQQQLSASSTYYPNLVYAERRREFLFEGKRWFDLLRMARRDYKRDPSTFTSNLVSAVRTKLDEGADLIGSRLASMDALYWPVYDDEMDRNPYLVQNAYYLSTEGSDDMVIEY